MTDRTLSAAQDQERNELVKVLRSITRSARIHGLPEDSLSMLDARRLLDNYPEGGT
jgi:hypothetical protein